MGSEWCPGKGTAWTKTGCPEPTLLYTGPSALSLVRQEACAIPLSWQIPVLP